MSDYNDRAPAPVPFAEYQKREAEAYQLRRENEELREQLTAAKADLDVAGNALGLVCCIGTLDPGEALTEEPTHAAPGAAYKLKRQRDAMLERAEKAEALVARSLRAESINDGWGWRLLVGDHVVLEWNGDGGISSDEVRCDLPALEYGVTTTATIRCLRQIVEGWNWPVACALAAGPGNGILRPSHEYGEPFVDDDEPAP